MRRDVLWACSVFVLVVGGCRPKHASNDAPTLTSAADSTTLKSRMLHHETHGIAMRDAVARADLAVAKREAKALADLRIDGGIEPTWRAKLEAMNAAAARLERAKDLEEASRALAAVAGTCGDCHAALGGPPLGVGEPPSAEDASARAAMQRHQWGAVRLWDGLVVPSDEAWNVGARVLTYAVLQPELLTPGRSPVPQVGTLAATVHDLGRKAEIARTELEREDAYGELMATCAACHVWLGGGPEPKKSK